MLRSPPRTPTSRRAKKKTRLATSADVARHAGVSQSAVSRTFTTGASVSKRTRAKVLDAARELRYRPNQMARSLMTNRSHIIGVAVTHLDNQFYPKVLEELSEGLRAAGYRILLFVTHGTVDFDPALDELLKFRVDALILASTTLSAALAAECQSVGVPVIMLNNVADSGAIASVSGQNYVGGQTAAEFLIAGGHERYAFLAGMLDSSTNRLRESGFATALAERGFPEPVRVQGSFNFDEAAAATRRLLAGRDRPDAIFCANDHMAIAALQVARFELGLEVGKELSIVGFDDVAIASWPAFQLTTYSQHARSLVKGTLDLLNELLEGRHVEDPQRTVSGELIVRSSARVPPRSAWPATQSTKANGPVRRRRQ